MKKLNLQIDTSIPKEEALNDLKNYLTFINKNQSILNKDEDSIKTLDQKDFEVIIYKLIIFNNNYLDKRFYRFWLFGKCALCNI